MSAAEVTVATATESCDTRIPGTFLDGETCCLINKEEFIKQQKEIRRTAFRKKSEYIINTVKMVTRVYDTDQDLPDDFFIFGVSRDLSVTLELCMATFESFLMFEDCCAPDMQLDPEDIARYNTTLEEALAPFRAMIARLRRIGMEYSKKTSP